MASAARCAGCSRQRSAQAQADRIWPQFPWQHLQTSCGGIRLECAPWRTTLDITEPSSELVTLRERTEEFLGNAVKEFQRVADRYEVPYHATRIILHPLEWTQGRTLLRFIAPIIVEVESTPELYRRLIELNNTTIFGKYYVRDHTVFLEHNLLGESLDVRQFRATLASVAHHADHLDDLLLAEFGGRKWSDHA